MSEGTSGARSSLGIEIVSVGDGAAVCTMTVVESMLNDHGTCHGGVIFTLADTAFEYACNSHGPLTVAASASIEYIGAVDAGSGAHRHRDGDRSHRSVGRVRRRVCAPRAVSW